MRLILALLLVACGTETVELVDARALDASGEDAGQDDLGGMDAESNDAVPEDIGAFDAEPMDAEPRDAEPPDSGEPCVCRFVGCRDTPECENRFGAGIACDRDFACTRFVGECQTTAECGSDLTCTLGPESIEPCP